MSRDALSLRPSDADEPPKLNRQLVRLGGRSAQTGHGGLRPNDEKSVG